MNISPIVYIDHIDKQMCSWISLPLFFIDHIDKQMCSWISLPLFFIDHIDKHSWTNLFVYVINVNNGRDIHEHICLSMWSMKNNGRDIHEHICCLHWSHRQTNVFMNISPIVYIDHIDKQMCSCISLPLFFIDHIDKQMCSWISLPLFTLIT
jgi:Zn-finger protein